MKQPYLGVAGVVLLGVVAGVEGAAELIRGVSLSDQSKFLNGIDCLPRDVVAPSATPIHVPFDRINDNYCDCAGGEDEPGSPAACGSAMFFCINSGHRGKKIPSSFVHDGVCDCCDGSDEPGQACANTCSAEGMKEREQSRAKAHAILKGVEQRAAMAREGSNLEAADRKELGELRAKIAVAERELSEGSERVSKLRSVRDQAAQLRDAQAEAEKKREDAEAAASAPAISSEEGTLNEAAGSKGDNGGEQGQGQVSFASENAGVVDNSREARREGDSEDAFEGEDDFAEHDHGGDEVDSEHHVESADDASVAVAGSNPDPGAADINASAKDEDIDEVVAGDEEALCLKLIGGSSRSKLFASVRFYAGMAVARLRRVVPGKLLPAIDLDEGDEVRTCVQRAEDMERDLRNAKNDLQSKIDDLEQKLGRDYGNDKSFRALDGKCFKEKFTQYEFELCVFDCVRQYENGNVIATLGSWGKWQNDATKPMGMMYENGDQCWNGPQRSTEVRIVCGAENQIISVDEPNRCSYHMVFQSPTACTKEQADTILAPATDVDRTKDEL